MTARKGRSTSSTANQYKSKFEMRVAAELEELLGDINYEPDRLNFIQPEKKRFYLPDFKLRENVYIETKGKWTSDDRAKHVWIKEQHPDVTIYLLFQNANVKLNKRSKTSYGDWATKNGLLWGDYRNGIPKEWLNASKQSIGAERGKRGNQRQPKQRGGTDGNGGGS